MPEKFDLRLSVVAEADLAALYEYGLVHWGERKADEYYDALIGHLDRLRENPFLYAPVEEIRPGYRRSVCGVHAIYYRVMRDSVEVMAVIGMQDMQRHI